MSSLKPESRRGQRLSVALGDSEYAQSPPTVGHVDRALALEARVEALEGALGTAFRWLDEWAEGRDVWLNEAGADLAKARALLEDSPPKSGE